MTAATIATTPENTAIRDSQQLTSPIGFLFLKLPPRPCAVLLVLRFLNLEGF